MNTIFPYRILFLSLFIILSSCENKQTNTEHVAKESSQNLEDSIKAEKKTTNKKILFFGDSITAGYQLEEEDAFTAGIQQTIDSLGLDYTVVNAGVSGETSSGGLNRIDWVLRQPVDIFCLELGANDALRGLDPAETEKNLNEIINKVKATLPGVQIILLGMMAPPNMGLQYSEKFNKIYPELATKHQCPIVPFLLDGVAGITELNLQDGIHPNKKGHEVLKNNVWKVLKDYL